MKEWRTAETARRTIRDAMPAITTSIAPRLQAPAIRSAAARVAAGLSRVRRDGKNTPMAATGMRKIITSTITDVHARAIRETNDILPG